MPESLLNYGSVPFFLAGLFFMIRNKVYKHPLFPVLAFWGVAICCYFLFEINMIAKVHDYYLFPFYPVLFILVGYGLNNLIQFNHKALQISVLILLLLLPFTAYLRMKVRWNPNEPGFNKDLLVYKQELSSAVPSNALCIVGNDESHYIFFYYIDKKGWAFQDDQINEKDLADRIKKGAQYLYSDTRKIDRDEKIKPFLDTLILQKGSICIYHLKIQ